MFGRPNRVRNTLFYGDNLDNLRKHVLVACVDLVYLDPPFNSNRDYNVLFKEQSGEGFEVPTQSLLKGVKQAPTAKAETGQGKLEM
jgi:16S rRNA G966 N2-methylase RsmD